MASCSAKSSDLESQPSTRIMEATESPIRLLPTTTTSRKHWRKLLVLLSLVIQAFVVLRHFDQYNLFGDSFDVDHYTAVRRNALASDNSSDSNKAIITTTSSNDNGIQMDLMVPAYRKEKRLVQFAADVGKAIADYNKQQQATSIQTFRVLVTRFSDSEKANSHKLQRLIAAHTDLPEENIVMVHAPDGTSFSRAKALNLLHQAACHLETCMVSRVDVDMLVRAEFFQHSVETIILKQYPSDDPKYEPSWDTDQADPKSKSYPPAYFPIVWSEYNPFSVQLVEEAYHQLGKSKPSKYSQHRGHWRYYGTGMYVLAGPDAKTLKFNTSYQGWGEEDSDFYRRTKRTRRIVRQLEPGLVHVWHGKKCRMGSDVKTKEQMIMCEASKAKQDGSKLALKLQKILWSSVKQSRERLVKLALAEEQQEAKVPKTTTKKKKKKKKAKNGAKTTKKKKKQSKPPAKQNNQARRA